MKTKDFYYDLPRKLIAQHPTERRDHSRLLVLNKKTGEMEHKHFYDIIDYLNEGDVLVLNDTKVMPARIYGHRKDKEEKIEFLLLNRKNDVWECLSKPGKKAKIGTEIIFSDKLSAEVVDISDDGSRFLKFEYDGIFEEILDELGEMPLPPYITEKLEDKNRYQTVYAREEGSAAAPTAGLHFTKELLDKVKNKGVEICYITLHVGLGTFRPVKVENIDEHEMHSEFYIMTEEVADKINSAKERGNRVIAVGTTSVRTVESIADESGKVREKSGFTNIFIYPPYKFKCVDALITNFHLPESTLLMLVSSLSSREIILNAYKKAVKERYRFFSFGDAMFIR
ncbi:tRNA preQ1(34) S-adenosylmethionine ribosyltransferase-isomerase QueA [Peptoniphilus lacydonensis]|uniref:tRNA preQ1(34) S-adenosylmethionine ribosyltransferase-isomerase QueA n=1 Tax=Peptoniphilus lacydonensis TaxID=1673725 RepID=UPI0008D941EF|nr:tRNA preQ1(34) S-adenosylmethionine ribosyltransferase-isomerase QueA [Peptoniphilus lacydonensis]MBS6610048.1 tRNA preQ1(34) S-adenosylmethionine ribosyltransferase-isomerase QueA [Peptoniphilus harei]MDU5376803.1 tRNA preQ1(34) S-adenosylmethionine ribosyltransferase-isomerase QueA [Peptoniphilus lacydonensis]MDU5436484.1 tRNA preQ1(34) S-adenosylmethionine ribosyltransferase-isomerase QueA [Peptoniphilus lacydonensis]